MRPFQVMRYGRRSLSTNHDEPQTIRTSLSLQSLSSRRDSISSSSQEQNEDEQPSNDDNLLFKRRRNTLLPNMDFSTRRWSMQQQQDLIEATKSHRTSLRNFYIFFLFLFLFLLMSLVYSFIRMIKNPH